VLHKGPRGGQAGRGQLGVMATDEGGDAIMAEPEAKPASEANATDSTPATASGDEATTKTEATEPEGPSAEERVTTAEVAKEAGNALLKSGDFAGAVTKYGEGIDLVEKLMEKTATDIGDDDLARRRTVVYVALCLNSAQACIKQSRWGDATEHADRVLVVENKNAKALYRRGVASMQYDTVGRLEQARDDLTQFVQLEPANREARDRLIQVKERLKEAKKLEKERYATALQGGLYQENHKKLDRQKLEYEEEVKRRVEASEDEISWEDWQKKLKDKIESDKKKEKEDREKRAQEIRKEEEQRQLHEANERREKEGLEAYSLEEWRTALRNAPRKEEVVTTDDLELDEEERKMLKEQKDKGYYHGRLGTVLSDEAPKPQQMREPSPESAETSPEKGGKRGSTWNQAGTWEERETSAWVKERLEAWLAKAFVGSRTSTLESGEEIKVSAEISKVKSLSGDAQIVLVRNQPRFGYTYEAQLAFRIRVKQSEKEDEPMPSVSGDGDSPSKDDADASKVSSHRFDGTLTLPELCDSVPIQELRIDGAWKSSSPPERLKATVQKCLRDLQESVREQVAGFLSEYKTH